MSKIEFHTKRIVWVSVKVRVGIRVRARVFTLGQVDYEQYLLYTFLTLSYKLQQRDTTIQQNLTNILASLSGM